MIYNGSTVELLLCLSIFYYFLSHDVASGSDITPCNRIDKPLVVHRFSGNVIIASIITLRKRGEILTFSREKCDVLKVF